jgi:hypothetical protein
VTRSTGVTLTAIAAALGAIVGLLFVGIFVSPLGLPATPPPQTGVSPAFLRIAQFAAITMFAVMSIWSAVTAIGLWKLKPWARWSVLIYAGLLLFVSLPAALFTMFVPMPPGPNLSEQTMHIIRWGISVMYGLFSLISAWMLYYFNRASIRAEFEGIAVESTSRRPMSITLIGAYLILAGLSGLILAAIAFPTIFFGVVLNGWSARAFYFISAIAYLWIGVGLLRLWPTSRIAAIVLLVLTLINSVLFILIPGVNERIRQTQDFFSNGLPVNTPFDSMPFTIGGLVFTAILTGLVIWFLVRSRPAFEPPPAPMPSA